MPSGTELQLHTMVICLAGTWTDYLPFPVSLSSSYSNVFCHHLPKKLLVFKTLSHYQFLWESTTNSTLLVIFLAPSVSQHTMAASCEHCNYHHAAEDPALCPCSDKDFCWPLPKPSVQPLPRHCTRYQERGSCPYITEAVATSLYFFSLYHEDPVNPERNNLIFQGLRPLAVSPCISLLGKKTSHPLGSS